jgi:cell division protein FtsI/penicillin-binding protein 2
MLPLPNQNQLRKDRSICTRIMVVTSCLLLGFSAIAYQLFQFQVRQHNELARLAAERFQDVRVLPAQRGSIRDRSGEYLVFDEKSWELHTDRNHLTQPALVRTHLAKALNVKSGELAARMSDEELCHTYHQHIASSLSEPLEMPASEILASLQDPRHVTIIKTDIADKAAEDLESLLKSRHIVGVYVRPGTERRRASKDRLTLTLGATKKDSGGIWGVEQLCENILKGTPGKRYIEKDRRGIELPLFRGETIPAKDGSDVFLTIDMNLQDSVEAIVDQAFTLHNPKSIVAILTDPGTGSILAMACRPHLNIEENSGNWRNIPVSDAYEPGSVMKIVAIAGALDAGKINPHTPIDCGTGSYSSSELGSADIHDDEWNLGTQPAWGVLAHSSNIGTYKIARSLGWDAYEKTLRNFGFGTPTGIGICKEPGGSWQPFDKWTAVDFSRMSYGYGMTATALQQVMAYGAIANGGVLMKPRLIDRILHDDGTRLEICRPQPIRQACTARTADQIRFMLEKAVTEGTGSRAKIDDLRIAGKTGTRRVYDPKTKSYRSDQYLVSFAGFAPAEKPRVACVVAIDNPKAASAKAVRGGLIAAPIFAELVSTTLNHLDVRIEHVEKMVAQQPIQEKGGSQ